MTKPCTHQFTPWSKSSKSEELQPQKLFPAVWKSRLGRFAGKSTAYLLYIVVAASSTIWPKGWKRKRAHEYCVCGVGRQTNFELIIFTGFQSRPDVNTQMVMREEWKSDKWPTHSARLLAPLDSERKILPILSKASCSQKESSHVRNNGMSVIKLKSSSYLANDFEWQKWPLLFARANYKRESPRCILKRTGSN